MYNCINWQAKHTANQGQDPTQEHFQAANEEDSRAHFQRHEIQNPTNPTADIIKANILHRI